MMSESLSLLLVLSILVKIVGFYWAFSFWVFFFLGLCLVSWESGRK